MLAKSLIGIGIIILAFCIFPVLLRLLIFFRVFSGNESAGIGAFGVSVIEILFLIFGIILIVIGGIISYRNKVKAKNKLI